MVLDMLRAIQTPRTEPPMPNELIRVKVKRRSRISGKSFQVPAMTFMKRLQGLVVVVTTSLTWFRNGSVSFFQNLTLCTDRPIETSETMMISFQETPGILGLGGITFSSQTDTGQNSVYV